MKQSLLVSLVILGFACTSQPNQISISSELPVEIDTSSFVRNLEYERIGYIELSESLRSSLSIEGISEKQGEEYLYRLFEASRYNIGRDFSIAVFYVARNERIPLDAYVERYFIATFDQNENLISIIEAATYEAHFGFEIEKSCQLSQDLKISTKTIEKKEDMSNGDITDIVTSNHYMITETGKIELCQ